ncbi:caspase family protein [Streptomyces tauricus]|nr:caspase family protein [Streptomyces tauricus]
MLFVSQYESDFWQDLGFLDQEYRNLTTVLASHGYIIDRRSDCGKLRAADINQRIDAFIQDSCQDDYLLVYLSGHGYHYGDTHWFAAHDSDLTVGVPTMSMTNVRLDGGWPDVVEQSAAKQALFVVDACRDRLTDETAGGRQLPIKPPDGSERLSYLMACEPERSATYLASRSRREETFSLFTQALQDVLIDASGLLPADRLRELLEAAMNDLQSQNLQSVQRQTPRLSGEEGSFRFPFLFEGKSLTIQQQTRSHRAWSLTSPGFEAERLQTEVDTIASALDENFREERKILASDNWLDWHAHHRASTHSQALIQSLPADSSLTAVEAAVLALAPHLYQGFRVRLARKVDQALRRASTVLNDSHGAWAQFPRLQRLTDTKLDPKRGRRSRRVAESWALHQFLARPGDAHKYEDELLNYLDSVLAGTDDLAEILNVDTVSWIFRAMFYGGSTLAESPDFQTVNNDSIRYQFLGYILSASQIMALDICELAPVLVEHFGGHGRLGFLQIRNTINDALWQLTGRTLRLEARCSHQALMVALQERAESLDGLLYTVSGIAGLERLPNRSSGDGVGPEEDPATGQLRFLPVATRFGLDGTRVRDLLAGEQLYADRSLAVRELYQNAMDACNVRRAREIYRPGLHGEKWEGRIEITQGRQGDAKFLECTDNGSGMGRGELLLAFAQGGVRLSHLTEFQEEKLQWKKKNVPFFENSRFGIGVLSYFMLADEIEVVTRKFHRDRSSGRILRVTISGPDDLLHVEELSENVDFLGNPCGSRVRWYLRDDLDNFSCVSALRAVLGVAKYTTKATFGEDCEEWEPAVYRSRPDSRGSTQIDASGVIAADARGEVSWCEYGGALLVDGISARGSWDAGTGRTKERKSNNVMKIPGAVVNLTGPVIVSAEKGKVVPRLTVDRSQVIDDIFEPLAKRMRGAAATLSSASFFNSRWLEKATQTEPRFADVIVEGLIGQGAILAFDDGLAAMVRTGYFPGDESIRADWQYANPPEREPAATSRGSVYSTHRLPAHLSLWRYAAHFPDDVRKALGDVCPEDWDTAKLKPALPSDAIVLGGLINSEAPQLWDAETTLVRILKCARELHRDIESVADQLQKLGQSLPSGLSRALTVPPSTLHTLLSLDGQPRFRLRRRIPHTQVAPWVLLRSCDELRIEVCDAISLLVSFNYDVSQCRLLESPSHTGEAARILLSERMDGRPPWISDSYSRSTRVVAAADKLQMEIHEVVSLCKELGLTENGRHPGDLDYRLRDSLGTSCLRSSKATVADVLRVSRAIGAAPRFAEKRIKALGVSIEGEVPESVPEEASLLSIKMASDRALDPSLPVSLPAIDILAQRDGESMETVGVKLRGMGLDVPFERFPDSLEKDDLKLLSRRFDTYRVTRWLNPRVPVPAAHIFLSAVSQKSSPQVIVDRLTELGMTAATLPTPLPNLRVKYEEEYAVRDWIPYDQPCAIPLGHVMMVSMRLGISIPQTVDFLVSRGLTVSDIPADLQKVNPQDAALLRRRHFYSGQEVTFSRVMGTEAVILSAQKACISAEEARKRFIQLGADISKPGFENFSDKDLFSQIPEGSQDIPAAAVLITAESSSIDVSDVVSRLQAAGLNVQTFDYPLDRAERDDLAILRNNGLERGKYLSFVEPVEIEHLLVAAHRVQRTVEEVGDRLSALGLSVPDIRASFLNAWRMVPRT